MSNVAAGIILVGAFAFISWFTLWVVRLMRRDDPAVTGDGRGRALPPIDEANPSQLRVWQPGEPWEPQP